MERVPFEAENFYHVYGRGIDKRPVFIQQNDYERFIISLYHFNDIHFLPDNFHYQNNTLVLSKDREELVEIMAWCLMPNHYHLVVSQKMEGGITKFMRRLGTGFTMYFNKKYERTGNLFEKPFKAKHIDTDDYLLHVTRYIHLNPLGLYDQNWKEKGVRDTEKSKELILQYPWSSIHEYVNKPKRPELISNSGFWEIFGGKSKEYEKFLWEWLVSGVPKTYQGDTLV